MEASRGGKHAPDKKEAVSRPVERQNVLASGTIDAAVVPGHGQGLKLLKRCAAGLGIAQ